MRHELIDVVFLRRFDAFFNEFLNNCTFSDRSEIRQKAKIVGVFEDMTAVSLILVKTFPLHQPKLVIYTENQPRSSIVNILTILYFLFVRASE